jgi:xylose isomerase
MKREVDHLAKFLHMAVDYKKQIGFKGPFYLEPKPVGGRFKTSQWGSN